MTLDDHLRGLSLKDQVAALSSYLLAAERERDEAVAARDEALALLAEAWEWTTPSVYGKLGYVDLQQRVRAALQTRKGREAP